MIHGQRNLKKILIFVYHSFLLAVCASHRVLQLASIRRCGRSDCFFYMEVGRSSCTGEGDLWMQTEDTNIADNMYAVILK
jgi:hypothetical protein